MKRLTTSLVAMAALLGTAFSAEPDHAAFDALLSRYVAAGQDGVNRVDYSRWKAAPADRAALDGYIARLAAAKPSSLSRDEQFAYWANLYNAVTLDTVLDRYPVASIRDIRSGGIDLLPGPWRKKAVTVEGKALSLDDIEHGILRAQFKDPRVHYAVNCASIGCPNLRRAAFRAETLSADLDAAARDYVGHPRGVTVTDTGLRLSTIYKWFAADFGDKEGLRAHLARYAPPEKAARIRSSTAVAGYGYDWSLNDTRRK